MVLPNPCVGSLPTIKISFFLLSTNTAKLISAPNITTLLPNPKFGNAKVLRPSNYIPHPE